MQNFKKHLKTSVVLAAIMLLSLTLTNSRRRSKPPESPTDKYQKTWEHKALSIQNKLDKNEPLINATYLHTHNTYNSRAYTTAFSYIDPNHYYSIKDQLRMDVSMIELDVHWYFSMAGWPWQWKKTTLLCHGQGNHLGCSAYDRHLSKGVDEINSYIRSNRDKVIILYVEEHVDGHYNETINTIKGRLGDLIYRTGSNSCKQLPGSLTKQQVLNAGKNIVIFSGAGCQNNSNWNQYVHMRSIITESNMRDFKGYPNCGKYSRNDYKTKVIRFYEDRTNMTAWFGGGSGKTTKDNMDDLVNCGVNFPGMDKLSPTDGRLRAAIWSFHPGEPNNWGGNEDCVHQWGNGKWNDNNCNARYRFACKNGAGDWYVTKGSGTWSSGYNKCSSETGGQYSFATPHNGYENKQLEAAKKARGVNDAWLSLNDRSREGTWRE